MPTARVEPDALWKVRYEDLEGKAGRRPFWKQTTAVTAPSRKAAVENVMAMFPPPLYGNFKASRLKGTP